MRLEDIVKIKLDLSKAQFNTEKFADLEKGPDDPCQDGYVQLGTKMKDGKEVPNCVPLEQEMSKVKEGFPIPSPEGEDEQKYISRCISAIVDEYPAEGQAYAICKAKWDEK